MRLLIRVHHEVPHFESRSGSASVAGDVRSGHVSLAPNSAPSLRVLKKSGVFNQHAGLMTTYTCFVAFVRRNITLLQLMLRAPA